MPGWHEATKALQDQGKVQMVGIVEEQHPDRARLFMQWKRMGWPILVDSLDLLDVPYVPITLGIDERGVVRVIPEFGEGAGKTLEALLGEPPAGPPAAGSAAAPDIERLRASTLADTVEAWRAYGDALFLWGGEARIDEAVEAFERAAQLGPGDAAAAFRLGVALRRRFETPRRQYGDFQEAAAAWKRALDLEPNNYIYRRRIQQFGPRLEKPYAFYDWVAEARKEIQARGGTPAPLVEEPGGAEIAGGAESFEADSGKASPPDPNGRVHRDDATFIHVETAVVPQPLAPGGSARVHAFLRPNLAARAHWNNEAEDLVFWIDPPAGWQVDARRITVPRPREPVSQETRKVELEVRAPAGAPAGPVMLPAYALYYVCEDVRGVCLYRRQDVTVRVEVAGARAP